MTDHRYVSTAGPALLGALLVMVAPALVESQEISPGDRAAIQAGPASLPMTVRPTFRDRTEAIEASIRGYPAVLRDSGIGGRVVVWFYISDAGQVLHNEVAESSGNDELDQAALRVAALFQFTPATNGRVPVAVWIQLPITFAVR